MSLEAILAKIENDAREKAREIIESAENEKQNALHQVNSRIKERHHRDTERIRNRSEAVSLKMKHHLQREMEKAQLSHRRHIVDDAIAEAVRKAAALPDYLDIIETLLGQCDLEGEVEVIAAEGDSARITGDFLKRMSTEKTNFVLSKETHRDFGGIVMRSGDISLNATLSMIAELNHDSMVMELSRLLPLPGQVD